MRALYAIMLGFCSIAYTLEFGSMGNTSASMGGAGVALKHSAWGLYYNPALLSSSPKVKLGYSLGIALKEHNLAKITKIDVQNMSNTAERLIQTFTNGSNTSVGEITNIVEKALDSLSTASGGAGGGSGSGTTSSGVADKLKTYLQNKQGSGDYSDLANAIKTQVAQSSSLSQAQKDIIDSIASGIDYKSLNFSSSTAATPNVLESITITKGGDKGLDKTMEDISNMQDILKDNSLSIVSQNGVILQISTQTMNEELGSLAVALFASLYSNLSIKADPNKLRLIIKGGNGYYELSNNGNTYSYKKSDENSYNQHSLIASLENGSDAHKLIATSFVLSEIPIGYARTFYLKRGNLNLGVNAKLMNGLSVQNSIAITKNTDFLKELKNFASLDNTTQSNSFGIDLGVLYELDLPRFRYLTLGLVAKNINSPTFKASLENIVLKPQYRLGIGYNSRFLTLAFDADLAPNDLIAFSNTKQQSQMIGGGVGFDLKLIDLRLGVMQDLKQDTGLILTAGTNVLGFLDIALQSSTRFTNVSGTPIPHYFNLRVGGSFTF